MMIVIKHHHMMEVQQVSVISFDCLSFNVRCKSNDEWLFCLINLGGQRPRRRGRRGHEMPNFENIMQEFLISISVSRTRECENISKNEMLIWVVFYRVVLVIMLLAVQRLCFSWEILVIMHGDAKV